MKNVYIFLADGFEEVEGLTVVDLLRRADIKVCTVSVTGKRLIHGAHAIDIMADKLFEECDYADADMFILPGGTQGTLQLKEYLPLEELLKVVYQAKKYIAAVCAAPRILGHLGMLEGRSATSYPGVMGELLGANVSEEEVVVDEHIITSRGLGTSIAFALKLIAILQDEQSSKKIGDSILYKL
jgi:DJ-1 family protein